MPRADEAARQRLDLVRAPNDVVVAGPGTSTSASRAPRMNQRNSPDFAGFGWFGSSHGAHRRTNRWSPSEVMPFDVAITRQRAISITPMGKAVGARGNLARLGSTRDGRACGLDLPGRSAEETVEELNPGETQIGMDWFAAHWGFVPVAGARPPQHFRPSTTIIS
jgi:hypothetical protein